MTTETDSPLIQHVERELRLAGLFDKDSDYDGMIGNAVLEIARVFSSQGHSGYSAAMTLSILGKVLNYENLSPLTYARDEWNDMSEYDGTGRSLWQNIRNPAIFSNDEGETWYNVNWEAPDA